MPIRVRHLSLILAGALASALGSAGVAAAAEQPRVVASILPLHSLAAAVMEGVGEPHLLVPPGASPHTFQLKPSDARRLQQAQLVIRVGEALETFLDKPLQALARSAVVIEVAELPGVLTLPPREGGVWEQHEHDHGHHHGEDHGREIDGHLWLDPLNGRAVVLALGDRLAELDPTHAERYRANARAEAARIETLHGELEARLTPVKDKPFVVFHDAYQYFEHRYGLSAVGSITVSPERQPSTKRLAKLRRTIRERKAVCVFAEPQFKAAIVSSVVEGTGARQARLDPLGTPPIEPGAAAYRALLRRLAEDLVGCLAPIG